MRKRKNSSGLVIVLLVSAMFACTGCPKKEKPAPPQPAKQAQPAKPAAAAVQKQTTSAKSPQAGAPQFDFTSKKDPFKPYAPEPLPQKSAAPVLSGKLEDLLPIQRYDVNRFKVSGIVVGLKENTALVIDPAGKGYVVKEGMLIGYNNGRITRITRTYLEIAEQFRDDSGRTRKRSVMLTLPQKK
jgi:type IV pilus assembly protein PilP